MQILLSQGNLGFVVGKGKDVNKGMETRVEEIT